MSGGGACGLCHGAEMSGGDACGLRHGDLRWSSLLGHEACEGCAGMSGRGAGTHTDCANGTFGGAPMGPRSV
eukprot:8997238-Pyramimonas_sp.AAC.1